MDIVLQSVVVLEVLHMHGLLVLEANSSSSIVVLRRCVGTL